MTPRKAPRPFVTVNFAPTWDARVSTRNLTPSDFSSARDKRRLLEIRSSGDAVLAGAGTVSADRMSMGLPAMELREQRQARGQSEFPLRVLISNSGKLDPRWQIFQKDFSPLHIFSTELMPQRVRQALADKTILHLDAAPEVDLLKMMRVLRRKYAVRRLVCEGGPTLLRSLLTADLVDELHVTLCPRIFGGLTAPTLTGLAGESFPESIKLSLREMEVVDGECFLRYRVLR